MTDDLILNYQRAVKNMQHTQSEARKVVSYLKENILYLESRWSSTLIQDTNPLISFPADIQGGPYSKPISAIEWPSGQKLAEIFANYHIASISLDKAWDQISPSNRDGLMTPRSVRQ